MKHSRRAIAAYLAVLCAAAAAAVVAGWTPLGARIDGDAYDWLLSSARKDQPAASVIVAIDEPTLNDKGGLRNLRRILADAIARLKEVQPAAIVVDAILADTGWAEEDQKLEEALRSAPHLVLAADLLPDGSGWEDPLPRFRRHAEAVGHVHADPDPVSRAIPLEKAAGRVRRWALALEAYRVAFHCSIEESPESVRAGSVLIPADRRDGRALYVRYGHAIPRLSAGESLAKARGKVAFVGVTALSAVKDRLMTPHGEMLPGVEIHAQAFETLVDGRFLHAVRPAVSLLSVLTITALAGLIFFFARGWSAYLLATVVLTAAHVAPYIAFRWDYIFPAFMPAAAAWLSLSAAAAWRYFFLNRDLRRAEAERRRYQQAIQFVAHEMRSPLTAIQGSSEIMTRYSLDESKRKQIANMIHSESKRLARMIQTFLDVERLSAGEMQLRPESFPLRELLEECVTRARALADRKNISIQIGSCAEGKLRADRELMEYAVYNLLNNAVKYSPSGRGIYVSAEWTGKELRIAVRDQGIGMTAQEVKQIFRKFYRTAAAEQSGEFGAGIGLSLVEQIVHCHQGRIEVESAPGQGSCFTIVLPHMAFAAEVPASSAISH